MASASPRSRWDPPPTARRVAMHVARDRSLRVIALAEDAPRDAVALLMAKPVFARLVTHYRRIVALSPEERQAHLARLVEAGLELLLEEGYFAAAELTLRSTRMREKAKLRREEQAIAAEAAALRKNKGVREGDTSPSTPSSSKSRLTRGLLSGTALPPWTPDEDALAIVRNIQGGPGTS